jgi:hypothetical protein
MSLLGPQARVVSASPIHTAVEVEIHISPDPEDRQVYKTDNRPLPSDWAVRADLDDEQTAKWKRIYGSNKWVETVALSNDGLLDVFNAVDARVRVNQRVDDRSDPFYAEWSVVYEYTRSDGATAELVGDYGLDLRLPEDNSGIGGARYAELVESNRSRILADYGKDKKVSRKKGERWDAYLDRVADEMDESQRAHMQGMAEDQARRAVVGMRPYLIQRAQTGARNRAVRALGIKSWYYKHELERPLIVRRMQMDWEALPKVLGEDVAQNVLLGLIEQQFGMSAERLKELSGQAPALPQPEVIDAEVEEELQDSVDIPLPTEPSFEAIQTMGFMTDKDDRKELEDGVLQAYLSSIRDKLIDIGYDTEEKRSVLLNDLFGTAALSEFVTGWFRLLEMYAVVIKSGGKKDHVAKVVKAGVEHQVDWWDAKDIVGEQM